MPHPSQDETLIVSPQSIPVSFSFGKEKSPISVGKASSATDPVAKHNSNSADCDFWIPSVVYSQVVAPKKSQLSTVTVDWFENRCPV